MSLRSGHLLKFIWKTKHWIQSFLDRNKIVDIWIWIILENAVNCVYIWTERWRSFGRVWILHLLIRENYPEKNVQITSKICFFLYTYFAATEATTRKACPNSTDPIRENRSGEDARLFYNRSIRENVEDFRVYRAYAHSSLFAFMNRYESEGTCSGPLMEICLKEKIEFRKWNQTHLMIKIFDVTVNDSGLYEVSARFRGLQSDEWRVKCLHVIHLEKKGKECMDIKSISIFYVGTRLYFPATEAR